MAYPITRISEATAKKLVTDYLQECNISAANVPEQVDFYMNTLYSDIEKGRKPSCYCFTDGRKVVYTNKGQWYYQGY